MSGEAFVGLAPSIRVDMTLQSQLGLRSYSREVLGRTLRKIRHLGRARFCVVCRSHLRRFLPHGNPVRAESVCPVCQSRERHRLAWLWIEREWRASFSGATLLHLAPEPEIARRLRGIDGLTYASGDVSHFPMVWLDICSLPLKSESVEFVYCSHVLNMLPRDRPAMTEIGRILKLGGVALVQVPQPSSTATREAAPSSSSQERLERFKDPDMYRIYGSDVVDRLQSAGLKVDVIRFVDGFTAAERSRLGLIDEDLYVCRRPR